MNKYQAAKEKARQAAIEWQQTLAEISYSYGKLAYFADYFTKLAKRYGLTEEFKAEGII